MNERRRSAFLAVLFNYASLVISLARNILFVPLYLRDIPMAEYGAWLATGGALALILINDFGLSGVVTQRMSATYGSGEHGALGRLAGSALAIGSLLAITLTAISLLFLPFLPSLGSLPASQMHAVKQCFVLAVLANGLGVIGGTAASVLRSLQRVSLGGWITLAAELCNVIMILVGLAAGLGLYALAFGLLLRAAILCLAGVIAVAFVCARQLKAGLQVQFGAFRDLIGESSRFFLSSIAIKIQAQANVFFVGAIVGPASAAVYSLTARAYDTVVLVVALINGSMLPSVTHLLGSGDRDRFKVVVLRLLMFLASLSALAMTVTLVVNPAFLALWVGKDTFGGQAVSILLAAGLFVSPIAMVAYDALLAQGKFRQITRLFVMSSVLQVGLLVLFLRRGLWVAPLVSVITVCFWGSAFWKMVKVDIQLTSAEIWPLTGQLALILAVSLFFALMFTAFYPAATTWTALVMETLIASGCLVAAYLFCSSRLRQITFEEIGTTMRAFRAVQPSS